MYWTAWAFYRMWWVLCIVVRLPVTQNMTPLGPWRMQYDRPPWRVPVPLTQQHPQLHTPICAFGTAKLWSHHKSKSNPISFPTLTPSTAESPCACDWVTWSPVFLCWSYQHWIGYCLRLCTYAWCCIKKQHTNLQHILSLSPSQKP